MKRNPKKAWSILKRVEHVREGEVNTRFSFTKLLLTTKELTTASIHDDYAQTKEMPHFLSVFGLDAATRDARQSLAHEIAQRKADIAGLEQETSTLCLSTVELCRRLAAYNIYSAVFESFQAFLMVSLEDICSRVCIKENGSQTRRKRSAVCNVCESFLGASVFSERM
eukprot:g65310.t1